MDNNFLERIKNIKKSILGEKTSSLDEFEVEEVIEYIDEDDFNSMSNTQTTNLQKAYTNDDSDISKFEIKATNTNVQVKEEVFEQKPRTVIKRDEVKFRKKIVSGGGHHAFLIKEDLTVWAIGSNAYGQLGLGHTGEVSEFTQVPLYNVVDIVAGDAFTFAITKENKVYACGNNENGQLGLGDKNDRNYFVEVANLPYASGIKEIDCGDSHTVITTLDGKLFVCGNNGDGQLGLGDNEDRLFFVAAPITNIDKVRCGYYHTVISTKDGEVYACGNNEYGQLGILSKEDKNLFTLVPIRNIKEIECGLYHTFFINQKDELWGCGNNGSGQLGLGEIDETITLRKVNIDNVKRVVSKNASHTFILNDKEEIFICGFNNYGQLGEGTKIDRKIPMSFGTGLTDITVGFNYTLVVDKDNNVYQTGKKLGPSNSKIELSFTKCNVSI